MYDAVSLKDRKLNVDRMNYLKKHNIVYQTPEYKGYDGFCIGNGVFGGMLYHTTDNISMTLSHTDALDFSEDGKFQAWAWESEEKNTAPVSCGKLTVTAGMPCFDKLYLKSYQHTLCMANGMAEMNSETPFSAWTVKTFCNHEYQMLVMNVQCDTVENVQKIIRLERWGSRNFFHDYEQMAICPEKNLFQTQSGQSEQCFYVMQKLRGSITLTMGKVVGEGEIYRNNSHSVEFRTTSEMKEFQIYIRSLILEQEENLEEALGRFACDTEKMSFEQLEKSQWNEWCEFWNKSFVTLGEDEYLEGVYYSYLYLLNSCSKGKYPVTFGGLWCPNSDIRNWGHYYHWNHQQIYWGIHASGHPELMENYYNYREKMMKNALADGKELYGVNGAFYSDISNYNGYQAIEPDTIRNLTPGAQIAMDFYRHYKYTCDLEFLKQRAYPFMYVCGEFYVNMLEKEADGYYRIKGGSSCYESYWILKETMTDWSMIQALFYALIEASQILEIDEEKREIWNDILKTVYPAPMYEEETGKKMLAAGRKWNNEPVRYGEGDYPYNTFGFSQLAGVYPAGVIGLSQSGSELFQAAVNCLDKAKKEDFFVRNSQVTAGHNAAIQLAARLGDPETMELARMFVEKYQIFKNGTCHFADIKSGKRFEKVYQTRQIVNGKPTDWRKVHEKEDGKRISLDTEIFLHNYFEAHANIFTGIQEMLLQSYDDVIHVFPAVENHLTAAFELYAQGGYKVISEIYQGEVLYIQIEGIGDRKCSVVNPWKEKIKILENGKEILFEESINELRGEKNSQNILVFEVMAGKTYRIERLRRSLEGYYINKITGEENTQPRFFRGNQWGCAREF